MKLIHTTKTLVLAASLATAAKLVRRDDTTYTANAQCTCDQMMRYYGVENAGLWGLANNESFWWQSGFMMGALADLISYDSSYGGSYEGTWATTYAEAPGYGGFTNFIDQYYDDEGWWANGFLAVYDLTGNATYLNQAIYLWNDISGGKTDCGGMLWEKGNTYLASIANELYIYLSASLANRVGSSDSAQYLEAAQDIWDWFFSCGVVNSDWYVQDGVNLDGCSVTGGYYSYNQGVILSAAAELYKATGNTTYLELAGNIANAATADDSLFTNSQEVITDCDTGCDTTSEMFKGPFFRGLAQLQAVSPNGNWVDYLTINAQSLWNYDLDDADVNGLYECNTGDDFSGPAGTTFDPVDQVAALACLNGAILATGAS